MNDPHWYRLVLGMLATWRITHLLRVEEGPWHILSRARKSVSPWFDGVLACFYCFSVWIALPAAMLLGNSWSERFWLWPALSAGAIALDRVITPPTPWYTEDPVKEKPDELLRPEDNQSTSAPPDNIQGV